MFLVNVLKIAKPITSLIAGYSTGVVVKNIITATTPADLGKYQSMAVKAGGFFIGGAVGGVIGDRIEKQFDNAVGQVLALGQAYPQLNSSNNFLNLQQNLADTEDKLAFARQYYNDAVATLNKLIGTIPWMFVAGPTGVSEREFYQTPR